MLNPQAHCAAMRAKTDAGMKIRPPLSVYTLKVNPALNLVNPAQGVAHEEPSLGQRQRATIAVQCGRVAAIHVVQTAYASLLDDIDLHTPYAATLAALNSSSPSAAMLRAHSSWRPAPSRRRRATRRNMQHSTLLDEKERNRQRRAEEQGFGARRD